jgi:uncharacterized protein YjbI with pentapeptide repeats
MDTYKTSTERLRAVADLIEEDPERHQQNLWLLVDGSMLTYGQLTSAVDGGESEELVYNPGWAPAEEPPVELHPCNTKGCIAGWGVAMTPLHDDALARALERVPASTFDGWYAAGQAALGLEDDLASSLFHASYNPANVSEMLRRIADIPEGERTTLNAFRAGAADWTGTALVFGDGTSTVALTAGDVPPGSFVSFREVTLYQKVTFEGVNLSEVDFTEASWVGATFRNCDLSGANFDLASLGEVTFEGCALSGAHFKNAGLHDVKFLTCSGLDEVDFANACVAGDGVAGLPGTWKVDPYGRIVAATKKTV